MNEKGRQTKLLAAIAILAMVVCVFAVVMPSDNVDAATSTAPEGNPFGDMYTGTTATWDDTNDVFKVTQDTTITLTSDIGAQSNPLDFQIVIEKDATLTIQNSAGNSYAVYIDYSVPATSTNAYYKYAISTGEADNTQNIGNLVLNNVTLRAALSADSTTVQYCHILSNIALDLQNGSDLYISQSTSTEGTSIYHGSIQAGEGSEITFDNANGLQATLDLDGATVKAINNQKFASFTPQAGSSITNTEISFTQTRPAGDDTHEDFGMSLSLSQANVSITDSSISLGDQVAYLSQGVDLSGTTITAGTKGGFWVTGSSTSAAVTGGTLVGDFMTSDTGTPSITFNGTTLSNTKFLTDGITVTVGDGGIATSGNVDLTNATISNSENNNIIVSSGVAKLPAETQNVYVTNGTATVGETTISQPASIPVKDTASLNFAASVQNAKIEIETGFSLDASVTLVSGVEVTVKSGQTIILGNYTITATNATFNGTVVGGSDSSTAAVNLSGTYTIKAGSVDVEGNISGTIAGSGSAIVNITGTINDDLTISGSGTVNFNNVTVNTNADVSLEDGITYNTTGKFYLYGALVVPASNENTVTITVGAGAEFKAFPNATISPSITVVGKDSTSVIDLGEAMGTQYIRQDVTSNLVYSQTQTVVIEESIFIKKGATLTVLGQLIVNEGVEVIIEDGGRLIVGITDTNSTATVTVNGDITVEEGGILGVQSAAAVDISGTVESDGTLTINSVVNVNNGGSIVVDNGEKSVFTIDKDGKLTIDAGGNVEIRGQAQVTDITNKGTVTLNGAVLVGNVKISMAANDAVVDIKSFSADKTTPGTLEITDAGLIFKENKVSADNIVVSSPNTMIISGTAEVGIKGLVITEDVTSETKNKVTTYYNSFVLSGGINISDETVNGYEGKITVGISGPSIDVIETLTVAKNVTLNLTSGNLNVSGTITATADAATIVAAIGSDINVTGMIETCVEIKENINAFAYEVTANGTTVYYYTTLNTAIANGQTDIEALGTTSILETVDIPAGTTVKAGAGTSHESITIGSSDNRDVVVTVKDGGEFRSCIIDVMGTLTFDNKRNDRNNTITSDVYVEDDVSKSYTNIYTALNNAQSGETVTIYRTGSNVILDKDITVKEGVTLDIPSGKGVTVNDNVTMTVDGTVKLSGNLVAQNIGFDPEKDNNSTIAVNGTFMAVGDIPYADDASTSTKGYYIPGAYYNLVNTAGNWNYVTPVEDAAAVSNDVTDGEIDIKGTNQVGDVTFTGDEDQPVVITIEGKLTAGTITLVYASVVITNDANDYQFDGTIATSVGSIQFVNSNGFAVISTVDSEGATVMSIFGAPAQVDSEGADAKVTIATGNVSVLNDEALVNDLDVTGTEFEISSGATLTVDGANAKMNAKDLEVNGTLVAYDGGNVTAENVYVIGTFTVSPADSDNGVQAGTATVTNSIRVGISDDFKTTTAAALNAEKIGSWKNIYVSAESTVTEDLVKNKAFTQFYVEDALWFTVYANTTSDLKVNAPAVIPTENALLEKWTGKDVNGDDKTINGGEEITIGAVERFDANINYDIYKITVFADPGITAVYIDGKLMTSGYFENPLGGSDNVTMAAGFQTYVSAGNHEITYKLGNYFSGEAKMTVNGESVTGNTFTTSGMPESNDTAVDYVIYLQGIEASAPETPSTPSTSGDSGMGLTDYLLIILVILIVIMAIMVAFRLMRS